VSVQAFDHVEKPEFGADRELGAQVQFLFPKQPSPAKQGNHDMRKLLLTASMLALASAGALAQAAPQGVVPTAAVPQRTEPGRYWVFFAWNRADLPPDGRKVVEEAAQSFLRTGSARISLAGSADRTGSSAYNRKLSARRADAVRAELVRLGVPADAITVRAEGEDAPLVATAAGVREPLNRYVAIDFPERETVPPSAAAAPAAEPETPPAPEQAKVDPWQFNITPYLWAVALKGDLGVGRIDADVDASFDDILDNLNGALMLEAELRKGRFGVISDTIYANLEDNAATGEDRLKVDATANMLIQSLAATYRVGTWQLADLGAAGPLAVTLDPYAGARYTYVDTELKGKLDLPDFGINARRQVEGDEHWVDPIVGVRTAWTLGERWNLVVAGDVGGISTSDQYSAEAFGLVGYRFGLFGENNATALAGYRVLKQKYENGDGRSRFDWDMTIHGPIMGLKITF
jgi:outer membrane protein OmpA-like peptidoglycan-associated protein